MKPRIVIKEYPPPKMTYTKFLYGSDPADDPQRDFPFAIVLYAGPVIMESTIRYQTEESAHEGARKMVERLQAFFEEIAGAERTVEEPPEKLEYLRQRYEGFGTLELETQKSLAKNFIWPLVN